MAAALARARGLAAESAGVRPQRGNHAAPLAVRVLQDAQGGTLRDHRPRGIDAFDLSAFDRIVALDPAVGQTVRSEHDLDEGRLVTWAVPDPYGGSLADYRLCLEQIRASLEDLLSE